MYIMYNEIILYKYNYIKYALNGLVLLLKIEIFKCLCSNFSI